MTLFMIDLAVFIFVFVWYKIADSNQSGFFFDPYMGIHFMLLTAPILATVVNAFVFPFLYGMNIKYLLAFSPLLLVSGLFLLQMYDDFRNSRFYHKQLMPAKQFAYDVLSQFGITVVSNELYSWDAERKRGTFFIDFPIEEKETFTVNKNQIMDKLKEKYPSFQFLISEAKLS